MNEKLDIRNPGVKYRPIPFWSWNDKLEPAELRRQIRAMHDAGIGGFFMHARSGLQTEYLSQEWMDCINACLDEAKKCGMEAWLYDENGWPSGFCAGAVNGLGIKYQQKYLRGEIKKVKDCGTEYTIAYYTPDGKFISRDVPSDVEMTVLRCFYEVNPFYVDNLDGEVVDKFLEFTHERYFREIPEDLRPYMKGVFTDEPQLSRNGLVWSWVLEDEYRKEYGIDLLHDLPFFIIDGALSNEARIRYWYLTAKLFKLNFMKKISDWCTEHNWKLTGHHVQEEPLQVQIPSNGTVMSQYQYYHVPGMDHLCRRNPGIVTMVQVSSVAMQFGLKQVLTESFALCGWNFGFHGMCWMYQQQMAHGINLLCQHLESYSLRGLRKRDYPGSNFVHQPWWDDYKRVNDYFSRAGMLLAEGKIDVEHLVVHPASTGWKYCNNTPEGDAKIDAYSKALTAISCELDGRQIEHHYTDDLIFAENGSFENGRIRIGKCSYSKVIIPQISEISPEIAAALQEFDRNNGKIYVVENTIDPQKLTIGGREADDDFKAWFAALPHYASESAAANAVANDTPNRIIVTENGSSVTEIDSTWRDISNLDDGRCGRFYLFANKRYTEDSNVEISLPATGKYIEIIDNDTGKFRLFDNAVLENGRFEFDYPFAPGEGIMLFVSDQCDGNNEHFCKKDVYAMPCLQKIDDTFEVVSTSEGNILTFDRCSYRVDKGEWIDDDVCVIHHRLLRMKKNCELEMAFKFDIEKDFDLATPLTLAVEMPQNCEFSLNGMAFANNDQGMLFDQAFRKINLPANLKYGENILQVKMYYQQHEDVYTSLEKARYFETEFNKITYDSEVENIYLAGNFRVNHSGSAENLDRGAKRLDGKFSLGAPLVNSMIKASDVTIDGMPFFAGKILLRKKIELNVQQIEKISYLRFKAVGANSYRFFINGKEAAFLYGGQFAVPLKGLLNCGENIIEVEITVSLRNMLGPWHLEEGESYVVHTQSWCREPDALDHRFPAYNEDYCLVSIGMEDMEFI